MFTKGNLLTKTRKLVNGMAKSEPIWLKAMELWIPGAERSIKPIVLPEDVYVNKFFKKFPDSKHEDAIKICDFDPPPARVYGWRVLELKEQGVGEDEAMSVADMEYRNEKKSKKQGYARLKQIARLQGKRPPPNPYPSAIKEIQAEERPFIRKRFLDPEVGKFLERLIEEKYAERKEFLSRCVEIGCCSGRTVEVVSSLVTRKEADCGLCTGSAGPAYNKSLKVAKRVVWSQPKKKLEIRGECASEEVVVDTLGTSKYCGFSFTPLCDRQQTH